MAKKSNDDSLFGNINIDGFENELLTVDVPMGSGELKEQLEGVSVDDIQVKPPVNEVKQKPEEVKPQKPIVEEELLTVDTGEPQEEIVSEKKESNQNDGSIPEENDSPVYLHAAALRENGVLPDFDLEVLKDLPPADGILKINEHIQKQIETSIQEGVEEYKATIGDKAVEFIEALEKGVPFEDISQNYTLEQKYGSITTQALEEDEQLQESIYADLLTMKGFSESKVKKMVEQAKNNDDLLNESVDGLKEIHEAVKEERKTLLAQAEAEKQEKIKRNEAIKESIHKTVVSTKEIIPGIEMSEAERKEIIKMMTVPIKYVNQNGQNIPVSAAMELRAKDPISYEMKLNYFIKNGFFDDNAKFDVLLKKTESKATARLIEKMNGERRNVGAPAVERQKEVKKENGFVFPQNIK